MNKTYELLIAFKTLGFGLILATSLTACGFDGDSWKEEVLLHDGSKIIVERSVKLGGRHELGQKPPIKEQMLSFTMASTNERITWEDHYSEDVGSSNFSPMLVEVFGDDVYVLGSPVNVISYSKWGCPNPPYVVFKYKNKQWKRISLNELPAEVKLPNLVISSPDDVEKKANNGVLSVEMIKQENDGFKQPEYRTIMREPVASIIKGCLVPMKGGGWQSLGGPKAPEPIKPIDAKG